MMVVLVIFLFLVSIYWVKVFDERLLGWREAGGDELFREDNKFLSVVILLQGIMLLALDRFKLFPESLYEIVVVETVLITFFFYVSRSYAHIRNDSVWRLRSVRIIMTVVSADLNYCTIFLFKSVFPAIGSSVVYLFSFLVMLAAVPVYLLINALFEKRYGCS
jgi:hypothetical protein